VSIRPCCHFLGRTPEAPYALNSTVRYTDVGFTIPEESFRGLDFSLFIFRRYLRHGKGQDFLTVKILISGT
jgi:hypothetical protein